MGDGGTDRLGNPIWKIINPGKWGFIDEKGDVIIPIIHGHPNNFSDGLALLPNRTFIDRTGKVVITLDKHYEGVGDFKGGFAKVWISGLLDTLIVPAK